MSTMTDEKPTEILKAPDDRAMLAMVIMPKRQRVLKKNALAILGHKDPERSDRKSDDHSDFGLIQTGRFSEDAGATYCGVEMNMAAHMEGDDGYDFIFRGLKVDVKGNHRFMGYLFVEEKPDDDVATGKIHHLRSNIIISAHARCRGDMCFCKLPNPVIIFLAGWVTRKEFLANMQHDSANMNRKYILTNNFLHPMHLIWDEKFVQSVL